MLRKLINLTTSSYNPPGLGFLPGGAGVLVPGSSVAFGISAPYIEQFIAEVNDTTASGSTPTPAPRGTLLVMNAASGQIGGASWTKSNVANKPIPGGQYGIVFTAGQATEETASGGVGTGSVATIVTDGPTQAFLTTNPTNTTAISAGMSLSADGFGNLTYAGASPAAGVVLATALDSMATNISVPTLRNVYVGGY